MRLVPFLLPATLLAACPLPLNAQTAATCGPNQNGHAERVYTSGGVFAPLSNTGWVFVPTSQGRYYGFAELSATAIPGANLWIGGRANGEIRFSGGNWEQASRQDYSAGPLTAQGMRLPDACARFGRIWLVTREDLTTFVRTGQLTDDIRDWPWDAGAPVEDGDGTPGNYNLAGGDRPALYGDATAWWVMNGTQAQTGPNRPPSGMEVQATATALPGQTTQDIRAFVVRYRLVWKPTDGVRLTDAYVGMWSDMDNGYAQDDYVGTDSTASLIYTYNGDDDDEGPNGYAQSGRMGAVGMQIAQGPRVDRDGDGTKETTLRATAALRLGRAEFANIPGMPGTLEQHLAVMSGRRRDGEPITQGGQGQDNAPGAKTTRFLYSGTPGTFWSEDRLYESGSSRNTPYDRFNQMVFSGPFTMQPGETQDLVVAFPIATVPAGPGSRFAAVAALRTFARLFAEPPFSFEDLRVRVPAYVPPPVETFAFSLGPLPATTTLRATAEVPAGGPALSLDLFDALGRRVRSFGDVAAGTRGTREMDVSDVPPGVYSLRLTLGGAGTTWRRVVVVR